MDIQTVIIDFPTSSPSNFDDVEKIIHHSFYNELRVAPEESPTLITEPPFAGPSTREKITQIMFETFSVPAFAIISAPILQAYSQGKKTGLYINSGLSCTSFCPVVDGVFLREESNLLELAGGHLSAFMALLLEKKGYSFTSTSEKSLVVDIKEKVCFVSENFDMQTPVSQTYELPDGAVLELASECYTVPEALFKPSLVSMTSSPSWSEAIASIINVCPYSSQRELWGNIVLSGGNTLFRGLPERLTNELNKYSSYVQVVQTPEAKYQTWLGGSLLSTRLDEIWFSKENYDEKGPKGIHEVCTPQYFAKLFN